MKNLSILKLSFHGSTGNTPELVDIMFYHPLSKRVTNSTRGKFSGAYVGFGTFQWTKAVIGFSILAIKTAMYFTKNSSCPTCIIPHLSGVGSSYAQSLDYAIDKNTNWLADIFGTDENGDSIYKRFFLRTNPSRKRPGPVVIAINSSFFNIANIEICLDGIRLTDFYKLNNLLEQIESYSTEPIRNHYNLSVASE